MCVCVRGLYFAKSPMQFYLKLVHKADDATAILLGHFYFSNPLNHHILNKKAQIGTKMLYMHHLYHCYWC